MTYNKVLLTQLAFLYGFLTEREKKGPAGAGHQALSVPVGATQFVAHVRRGMAAGETKTVGPDNCLSLLLSQI